MVCDTNVDLQRFRIKALLVFDSVSAVQRCQGYAPMFPNSNSILQRYRATPLLFWLREFNLLL